MPLYDVELQLDFNTCCRRTPKPSSARRLLYHVKGILHRWSNLLIGEEQFEVLEKEKLTNATDDTAVKGG